MQSSANRNEFALTESHQARVTKNLQHDNACREQRGKSVYYANKKSQWQGWALISFSILYTGNPAFVNVGNMAIHYFLGYGKSQIFPVNRDELTSTQIWKSGAPEKSQS